MNNFIINDQIWATELEQELTEYIESLQNWYIYGEEEGEEP